MINKQDFKTLDFTENFYCHDPFNNFLLLEMCFQFGWLLMIDLFLKEEK